MNLFLFKTWVTAKLAPKSERGANVVEYILLLAFIAIVVLVAVSRLGTTVSSKFTSANTALSG